MAVPHYRNADALFEDVEADHISFEIGFLCSPTHLHVPQALQLITGHYHVFIEKPISGDSKTAREVVSAGRKAGVQVFVGHHRRQNPYLRQVSEFTMDQI